MERWERPKPPPPPAARRIRTAGPSFSSSLLDAICRSLDEDGGGGPTGGAPNPALKYAPVAAVARLDRSLHLSASDSSDSSSSFGGFSSNYSSDADSAARSRSHRPGPTLARSDPIRRRFDGFSSSSDNSPAIRATSVRSEPIRARSEPERKKDRSIGSKIRDLRKKPRSPSSPGARLAGFVAAIFAGAAGTGRRAKIAARAGGGGGAESGCSTASSHSRASRRSVRFGHVSVIDGPIFPMGEDDGESDSSSDLFELESVSRVYCDELPVYETTSFEMNRAIARGLVV